MNRARRQAQPLSLIMLDIDFFKNYNDAYGHVIGDEVLRILVQAIRAYIKRTDLVGRWGGEEFCIALLSTDIADAKVVARRVRQTLAETRLPQLTSHPSTPPTVSQGIAAFPAHARDTAQLIDLADAALYRAKACGRDQVSVTGEEC